MNQVRELPQDAADLLLLIAAQLDQTVIQLDRLRRLDEQRAAGVAAAVDDAGDAAALLAAQREHHAVFVECGVGILEVTNDFGLLEQPIEYAADFLDRGGDGDADAIELVGGVVAHG